jgi:hypothetical protein
VENSRGVMVMCAEIPRMQIVEPEYGAEEAP